MSKAFPLRTGLSPKKALRSSNAVNKISLLGCINREESISDEADAILETDVGKDCSQITGITTKHDIRLGVAVQEVNILQQE